MWAVKRVYEPRETSDGVRCLVDRLWPRGIPKAKAPWDRWERDLAPSPGLRQWYGHEPSRFPEFRRRYRQELQGHPERLDGLRALSHKGAVTLLTATRDVERSGAAVLAEYLREPSLQPSTARRPPRPRPSARTGRRPPAAPPASRALPDPRYLDELRRERELKDRFLGTQPESPFSEANLPFHPLRYFQGDPAYRVPARFHPAPSPPEVFLRTSLDNHASMRRLGVLSFTLAGRRLRLELYHAGPQAGNVAFLPFRDRTCGKESYGPGRYLNVELREGNDYLLDFNRAFNPYCAYTPAYECPFPPPQNDLPVEVRAGEKVYDPDHNPASPEKAIWELTVRFRERAAAARGPPSAPTGHRPDPPA
jgi:uncharacterized protein YeaO (DUF488 family)